MSSDLQPEANSDCVLRLTQVPAREVEISRNCMLCPAILLYSEWTGIDDPIAFPAVDRRCLMQSIMLGMPLQVAQEHKDSTHRAGLSGTGTDTILRAPYVMYHSTYTRTGQDRLDSSVHRAYQHAE